MCVILAEVIQTQRRTSWLSPWGGAACLPEAVPNTTIYRVIPRPPGIDGPDAQPIDPAGGLPRLPAEAFLVRLPQAAGIELVYPKIHEDANGFSYDLILHCQWSLTNAGQFLAAMHIAEGSTSVTVASFANWVVRQTMPRVAMDALAGHCIKDLQNGIIRAPGWWNGKFREWLPAVGGQLGVDRENWSSADAERFALQEQWSRRAEQEMAEQERRRKLALRERENQLRFKEQNDEINREHGLSEEARLQARELSQRQHQLAVLNLEEEINQTRRNAEQNALEHEKALARIQNDAVAAQTADEHQQESDRRMERTNGELAELRATVEELQNQPSTLVKSLLGRDHSRANEAAERLVSPEFKFNPNMLAKLGYSVNQQILFKLIKEKADGDETIAMRKQELLARDMGTYRADTLRLYESLQFSFTTPRPGFVLVLNFGTSGKVYLQTPGYLCPLATAQVLVGRTYNIPGAPLFPWRGQYIENGPPGWEHIAVIVSGQSLVEDDTIRRSTLACPLVELSPQELETLGGRLESATIPWSAGVLTFLVMA